jgi:polar amino acid transport system substrate-binding protein
MRRISRAGILMPVALALLLGACGKSTPASAPSASKTPIPTVEIGDCETVQGSQVPAAPKGVDYKTQLKETGVLNVGSDNDYPPFEEIKPGAKEPDGFDVDLYTEVAKRLGLTAKSTTTSFDGLFTTSLPAGRFDVGVSAITIKEERKKTVDFSVPYFKSDLSLAINTQKTPNIKTIDDLTDQTVGAQKGTTGEACAQSLQKQGKIKEVKSFENTGPAFQDLLAGRIGAIINDQPASQGFIDRGDPILKVVQVIKTQEEYGFAFSKDKPDLRKAVDDALTAMMTDGTYATIYRKWFETEPPFTVPIQ